MHHVSNEMSTMDVMAAACVACRAFQQEGTGIRGLSTLERLNSPISEAPLIFLIG